MSFQTIKIGVLEYLTAEGIAAPHCFTTRHGGVSKGSLASLNIAMHRGDEPENVEDSFRILGRALGFEKTDVVLTRQTHSDIVRVVTRADHLGLDHHLYPECDALVTADPGTALVVFTADCTPILLHDSVNGAVGAIHAGWRGTATVLAAKAVQAMQANFGSEPKNIRAAIGPNIGPCCFETDTDVPDAMLAAYGDEAQRYIRRENSKFYVNLKEINALALRRAGVESIEISTDCTMCQPGRFWSHRVTKGDRGSQGAIIICKEGQG